MEFLDIASSRVEGECHTKHPPPVAVRRPIVDAYLRAFLRTPLMFRPDDAAMLAYALGRAPAFGTTVSVHPGTGKTGSVRKNTPRCPARPAPGPMRPSSSFGRGTTPILPDGSVRPFRLAIDSRESDGRYTVGCVTVERAVRALLLLALFRGLIAGRFLELMQRALLLLEAFAGLEVFDGR